ncbi:Predicted nucleotidyltransferase [Proteiniborus ethanoligenes]|uniref:Predicted nucleotidyltransferase n=1 Tax=Proteiniborus ethanoligenes TaxID=415015 RepID=A0A1H3QI36_9FIRM|nr:nucleotidyltransferase domain-containing protein [Proteiniborus ethanoligenes]SDZ12655.1 Predicted nucleotidyltransferase [Proteiniborus ethanoligenes]
MGKIYTKNEIRRKLLPVFSKHPIEKAILFGSYARGNPTHLSDIDILIDSKGKIRGIDFYGVLDNIVEVLDIPVDLIEASQIIEGSRVQNEIKETGIIIYERA